MSKKIFLESLGCTKNLVDSEVMLGLLDKANYQIVDVPQEANVIIVNTCGFIMDAKTESIDTILEMSEYKKEDQKIKLVVTGCMPAKYKKEMIESLPEVDLFLDTHNFTTIVAALSQLFSEEVTSVKQDMNQIRYLQTPSHYAYLKIAEGCDNNCSYCLIPQLRGPFRSRPIEDILTEARYLLSQGVREIILIAQDTTQYGCDIYGEKKLKELLRILAAEPIKWLRMMYMYPHGIDNDLLETMADLPSVVPYFDMPVQHSENRVLKRMNRQEKRADLLQLVDGIRTKLPGAVLRTTCMVGFPGETEADFAGLLDFVDQVKFDALGAFSYSPEEDTPAAEMEDQVPAEEKMARYEQLMALQSQISLFNNEKWLGKKLEVFIEGFYQGEIEYYIARSKYQAPDVDGVIYVAQANTSYEIGSKLLIKITKVDVYDWIGEICNEFTE